LLQVSHNRIINCKPDENVLENRHDLQVDFFCNFFLKIDRPISVTIALLHLPQFYKKIKEKKN